MPTETKIFTGFTGYKVRVEVRNADDALVRVELFDMATPAERCFFRERGLAARPVEFGHTTVRAICVLSGKERVFTDAKTTTPHRFHKELNLAVQALR